MTTLTTINLKGVHRIVRRYGASVSLEYYSSRGPGAVRLGVYKAPTEEVAQAHADIDAVNIAARFSELAYPAPSAKTMTGVLAAYKKSPEWKTLADGTRRNWNRVIDRIDENFGAMSTRAITSKGARGLFLEWRDLFADRPREADLCIQVLSRVLNWAVDRELVERNRAAGIGKLWEADWSDSIWESEHIAAFHRAAKDAGREHLSDALELLAHTGLRVSDAVRLPWSAVDFDLGEVRWHTAKSRRKGKNKRVAVIPMTDALYEVLTRIPRKGPLILNSAYGRPYSTGDTLSEAIQEVAAKANIQRRTHDLRGTAATRLCDANLSDEIVGMILGWSPKQVARMRERYVSANRVLSTVARRLNEARRPVTATDQFNPKSKP